MSAGEIYRTLGNYPKARTFLMRAVLLIEPERAPNATSGDHRRIMAGSPNTPETASAARRTDPG